VVVGLTWIYPYDFHLWGGWPQGMGVLLALGAWSLALGWLREPNPRWAWLFGLTAAATLLTHGIDLLSMSVGLAAIGAVAWRRLRPSLLGRHVALAVAVGVLGAAVYLPTLLGW